MLCQFLVSIIDEDGIRDVKFVNQGESQGFPLNPSQQQLQGVKMRTHVKPAVLRALKENPRARDDNRWLYVEVLKQAGFPISAELEATVEQWPQIESVRRSRARIQNEEGRLLP